MEDAELEAPVRKGFGLEKGLSALTGPATGFSPFATKPVLFSLLVDFRLSNPKAQAKMAGSGGDGGTFSLAPAPDRLASKYLAPNGRTGTGGQGEPHQMGFTQSKGGDPRLHRPCRKTKKNAEVRSGGSTLAFRVMQTQTVLSGGDGFQLHGGKNTVAEKKKLREKRSSFRGESRPAPQKLAPNIGLPARSSHCAGRDRGVVGPGPEAKADDGAARENLDNFVMGRC